MWRLKQLPEACVAYREYLALNPDSIPDSSFLLNVHPGKQQVLAHVVGFLSPTVEDPDWSLGSWLQSGPASDWHLKSEAGDTRYKISPHPGFLLFK